MFYKVLTACVLASIASAQFRHSSPGYYTHLIHPVGQSYSYSNFGNNIATARFPRSNLPLPLQRITRKINEDESPLVLTSEAGVSQLDAESTTTASVESTTVIVPVSTASELETPNESLVEHPNTVHAAIFVPHLGPPLGYSFGSLHPVAVPTLSEIIPSVNETSPKGDNQLSETHNAAPAESNTSPATEVKTEEPVLSTANTASSSASSESTSPATDPLHESVIVNAHILHAPILVPHLASPLGYSFGNIPVPNLLSPDSSNNGETGSPANSENDVSKTNDLAVAESSTSTVTETTTSTEAPKIEDVLTTSTEAPKPEEVLITSTSTEAPKTEEVLITSTSTEAPKLEEVLITSTSTEVPKAEEVLITSTSTEAPKAEEVLAESTSKVTQKNDEVSVASSDLVQSEVVAPPTATAEQASGVVPKTEDAIIIESDDPKVDSIIVESDSKVPQPALVVNQGLNINTHSRFGFSYAIKDEITKDEKSHEETRDGDTVKGKYSVVDPDGSLRTVIYTADDDGFKAEVLRKVGYRQPFFVTVPTGSILVNTPTQPRFAQNVNHFTEEPSVSYFYNRYHNHVPAAPAPILYDNSIAYNNYNPTGYYQAAAPAFFG